MVGPVTEGIAQALADLTREVEESIAVLEHQLNSTRGKLDQLSRELEQQCIRLQLAAEEVLVEAGQEGASEKLQHIHVLEDELAGELVRAQALSRQLGSFLQLLAVSRHQLSGSNSLPDLDTAKDLLVRQAMIRAQEEERRRLSREIHDGPAQVLANAILTIQYLARLAERSELTQDQLRQELARVEAILREGLNETRQFMFALQPTTLQQYGLLRTLALYIETLRRHWPGELNVELPASLPTLTPEQELALFRVVQEALQNVQRHAHARHCWLRILSRPSEIVIEVADDGQGFRPESIVPTSSGGFGLQGMRERATLVGGELTIRSEPGSGTQVRLRLPLGPAQGTPREAATQEAKVANPEQQKE